MKKLKIFILLICLFVPLTLAGCENSNKNTLSTPSIVEIKGGTIVFNPVDNAEYYTISINENEVNVYTDHNSHVEIIDNKINYDASKIFVVGESYSIKIKANASKKNSSEFSSSVTYKHNGTITKPTNVKINATTLTWDDVENANLYKVKIITPNDNVIFDKLGNVLNLDDAYSISIADLTEYTFNTNQFDFSSLLNTAGTYQFYVCSVLSDTVTYIESPYTSKVTYTNTLSLEAPTNGNVFKRDGSLHLVTSTDSNANAISIVCNGVEKDSYINNTESITIINDNFIDINLNRYFSGLINFDEIKHFTFSTQSKYEPLLANKNYYLNSSYSSNVTFENTHQLSAPTFNLTKTNDGYLASWTSHETDLASGFKLNLYTDTGIVEYSLGVDVTSTFISEEFIAASIQLLGKGSYLSSPLSELKSVNTSNNIGSFEVIKSNTSISWTSISDAYYIVELNSKYYITYDETFNIPEDELNSKDSTINVHVIKQGYTALSKSINFEYHNKLDKPTFSTTQGFNSSRLYELTFTGSENAIGYYVYIKSETSDSFEKINKLFTSTAIDLSTYICSEGNYIDYEIKVQAVADPNGIYESSDQSNAIKVSHIKILESPQFYKLNETAIPVVKETLGNATHYFLQFNGVEDADSYEVLINFNKLTISADSNIGDGVYKVDITNYLLSANNYEIKIRSLPAKNSVNMQASEYSTANYALTKQLAPVENVLVTENEGVYTLTYDPIDNAQSYKVRIVKENDSSYFDYLTEQGLSNPFNVTQSIDVSQYVKQQGVYYFYITAIAPKNSFYADSNESSSYGYVNKLTSLDTPKNIEFVNESNSSYLLNWTGDDNADYYLVKLTDPNNISHEFTVRNSTSTNINEYMTIQGTYEVSIYSMVKALSENSKEYSSSSATNATHFYTYKLEQDFLRYSISMYGESYNFVVEDAQDLKNLLWYHYLYEIDEKVGLNLMIKLQQKEDSENLETLREAIVRIADEANNLLLYNFNGDETWLKYVSDTIISDNTLFSYVCQKLLSIYPEYHVLSTIDIKHSTGSNTFNLIYKNQLNVEKVPYTNNNIQVNTNYGNDYEYIDLYSRKSASGAFKIDAKEEMLVTTTEQLLHAVQNNKKPKFVGNSSTAETVYNNAKLVLSAIITNNMTDLEKVTAIFDWLEYGFDLTYYKVGGKTYISGSIEDSNLQVYGQYKCYYLEGIFEDITMLDNGDLVISNTLATSESYSKAFALLCAIEGINATVVNGSYTYSDPTTSSNKTVNHYWNKVYLDTSVSNSSKKWYSVDLTFSDNRIYFNDLDSGYGISSHTYFLTTDAFAELNLNITDKTYLISNNYKTSRKCETTYNYYANSSFGLTYNQISQTISNFEDTIITCQNFEYSKEFNPYQNYQLYAKSSGYGPLQAFLLNTMIYSEFKADNNVTSKSVFEFKFNWSDNGGSNIFDLSQIKSIFDSAPNRYNLKLKLIEDSDGSIYSIEDSENKTTTIVYIVEKTA